MDEIDLGKDTELIPVAHYTKVNRLPFRLRRYIFIRHL
jgi:hypothetical protein